MISRGHDLIKLSRGHKIISCEHKIISHGDKISHGHEMISHRHEIIICEQGMDTRYHVMGYFQNISVSLPNSNNLQILKMCNSFFARGQHPLRIFLFEKKIKPLIRTKHWIMGQKPKIDQNN